MQYRETVLSHVNSYKKILQIKLAQGSLIKIIFPLEDSPTLTSIYMPVTRSQNVLITKRYCASKKGLRTRTKILTKILVRVGEASRGKMILIEIHFTSLICKIMHFRLELTQNC